MGEFVGGELGPAGLAVREKYPQFHGVFLAVDDHGFDVGSRHGHGPGAVLVLLQREDASLEGPAFSLAGAAGRGVSPIP